MYFEKPGKDNTAATLAIALETAKDREIRYLVLSSTSGATAMSLPDTGDLHVVVVSSAYGSKVPNENRLSDETRQMLVDRGFSICTAAHALSGAERSLSTTFHGVYPVEIIAASLRMFGQGTKVCVEISAMAADAGLVPVGENIIAVGGSGTGADTALILKAANTNRILETKIEEVICKPLL